MRTTITPFPIPRGLGRAIVLSIVAGFVVALPRPAASQGWTGFYCTPFAVQQFVVPEGVTQLTPVLQGAHGGNPGDGAKGGWGGFVQATLPVTPGQTLYVWVGCIDEKNKVTWGYGSGGDKSVANSTVAGDGGFGGGGNGSTHGGGRGGNGGFPPQPGQNGSSGEGGCVGYPCNADIDGGDGEGASTASSAGGGGGGGGGLPGGGGGLNGEEPLNCCQGAGGGGGGQSYADRSATQVTFGTSSLAGSGMVVLSWPAGAVVDLDADGVPDQVDQCGSSDQSSTVAIDACDSGVENDLHVDGCTIADRIAEIAAGAPNHGQFVRGVVRLTNSLRQQGAITRQERQALLRCAVQADLP